MPGWQRRGCRCRSSQHFRVAGFFGRRLAFKFLLASDFDNRRDYFGHSRHWRWPRRVCGLLWRHRYTTITTTTRPTSGETEAPRINRAVAARRSVERNLYRHVFPGSRSHKSYVQNTRSDWSDFDDNWLCLLRASGQARQTAIGRRFGAGCGLTGHSRSKFSSRRCASGNASCKRNTSYFPKATRDEVPIPLTVSIAIASVSAPSGPFHARHTPATQYGRQSARPIRYRTCLPVSQFGS